MFFPFVCFVYFVVAVASGLFPLFAPRHDPPCRVGQHPAEAAVISNNTLSASAALGNPASTPQTRAK